ncbi:MAG: PilZ domain-containing protein [Gammaproteobacteria bacterium]
MRTDRREHPRIRISLPLEIIVANGKVLRGDMLDISRAGLQFCCDGRSARSIFPGGHLLSAGKSGTVQVRCSLALSDQSSGHVDASCQVIFSRRAAQDKYCIGAQFEQFAGDSYGTIERFINEHLT